MLMQTHMDLSVPRHLPNAGIHNCCNVYGQPHFFSIWNYRIHKFYCQPETVAMHAFMWKLFVQVHDPRKSPQSTLSGMRGPVLSNTLICQ